MINVSSGAKILENDTGVVTAERQPDDRADPAPGYSDFVVLLLALRATTPFSSLEIAVEQLM